jgi:hypothetical protein
MSQYNHYPTKIASIILLQVCYKLSYTCMRVSEQDGFPIPRRHPLHEFSRNTLGRGIERINCGDGGMSSIAQTGLIGFILAGFDWNTV